MRPVRHRARIAAAAAVLTLLASACGAAGGNDDEAATTTAAETTTTAAADETTTTEAGEPAETGPVEGWELPQEIVFNAHEWTIADAVVRDRQFADGEAPPEPQTWVEVSWTATSRLSEDSFSFPPAIFNLRFEDNTFADGVIAEDGDAPVAIQPETTGEGKVAFQIPEGAELSTAILEIENGAVEPGRIPLDGSTATEPERVDASVTPTSITVGGSGCELEMTLTDAYLSHELHLDDGKGAQFDNAGYRSPADTAYLHLFWDAESTGSTRCSLSEEAWTIDGTTETTGGAAYPSGSMWWAPNSGGWSTGGMAIYATLDAGESGAFVNRWTIPVDASEVSVAYTFSGSDSAIAAGEAQTVTVDISGLRELES